MGIALLIPTFNEIGGVLSFSTGLPKHQRAIKNQSEQTRDLTRDTIYIAARLDSGIDEVEESGDRGSKRDDVFCFAPNKNRRMFFRDGGIAATSVAVSALGLASNPSVASAGNPKSRTEGYAVQHTEREWAYLLSGAQYNILRKGGTERQKSSILNTFTASDNVGTYYCAACQTALFASASKFSSGTGWPSFARALEGVEEEKMNAISATLGGKEVRCGTCGGHLGDLFNDGWVYVGTQAFETGNRYCIDGAALIFKPANGGEDVFGDIAPPNKVINYEPAMFRDNSVNSRLSS